MRSPAPGPRARSRDAAAAACSALLADFSLDITSKELGELVRARAVIPGGTPVQLAFPDSGDLAVRVSTAQAIKEAGFAPVPIIAARRLRSQKMLREWGQNRVSSVPLSDALPGGGFGCLFRYFRLVTGWSGLCCGHAGGVPD